MPNALTIGITYDVFWHLNPKKLEPFVKSYENKKKIRDEEMWYMGQYIMSSLDATVCNSTIWKGKNGKPSKYVEKPFYQIQEDNKKVLSEDEKKKQLDKFVMSLKLMESNFKAEHKNKDGTGS